MGERPLGFGSKKMPFFLEAFLPTASRTSYSDQSVSEQPPTRSEVGQDAAWEQIYAD